MTCARTSLAPPTSGVKRKRARGQTLRHRFRLRGTQFADPIIKAKRKYRCRARRAREGRLIDHHYFIDAMCADHGFTRARFLIGWLTFRAQKIPIEHVVNEGGLSRAGNAGDACEDAEWKIDVDVLEVVLARAANPDRRCRPSARFRHRNGFLTV